METENTVGINVHPLLRYLKYSERAAIIAFDRGRIRELKSAAELEKLRGE